MTDWRQIQARIRRAKASADPAGKLSDLFKKFRDGMVAYELGALHEQQGQSEEAARWYGVAAQRFRRADWKRKAEEALERLGVPVPAMEENGAGAERASAAPAEEAAGEREEPAAGYADVVAQPEEGEEPAAEAEAPAAAGATPAGSKKRRRGRRGGRRHRKRREKTPSATPAAAEPAARTGGEVVQRAVEAARAPRPTRVEREEPPPASTLAELAEMRGRTVEPALASRLARLEAQLRRLLAAPLYGVDDTDSAPAGPGVLLLSDSDQVTHYYVEACATIRIALGNLLRSGAATRGRGSRSGPVRKSSGPPLRARLAEELGISESRVAKYLKDHCNVRWLQLDEGAPHLAHFAIAVLKPRLNE